MLTANSHKTSPLQKTTDDFLISRVIKTSFLLAALLTSLLLASKHFHAGVGFLIGALLSLFSFVTIAVSIPLLLKPKASPVMSALLVGILFLKLPIYCIGLYFVARMSLVSAFACAIGISLTPVVITMKTLGAMLRGAAPERGAVKPVPIQSEIAEVVTLAVKPVKKNCLPIEMATSPSLPMDANS